MCFTPLLAGAATGALSLPAVAQPIRDTLVKRGGHFHLARADEINLEKNFIKVQTSGKINKEGLGKGKKGSKKGGNLDPY